VQSRLINISLNFIGGVISLLAIVYVIKRLNHLSSEVDFFTLENHYWWLILILAICYAALNNLLTLAWSKFLKISGNSIDQKLVTKVYGLTILGKYAPGNVLQIVGRQVYGIKKGISSKQLAKASIMEITLLVVASSAYIALLASAIFEQINFYYALILFFLLLVVFTLVIRTRLNTYTYQAFNLYTVFLFFSGIIFVILCHLLTSVSINIQDSFLLLGIFIGAWLIGIVTPGAPAGLGVREYILILALDGMFLESEFLWITVLSRFITTIGDVIYFLYVFIFFKLLKT